MHQEESFLLILASFHMAQFTGSAKNSSGEVLVKVRDDAPCYPLESSVSTRRRNKELLASSKESGIVNGEVARDRASNGIFSPEATRLDDPHWRVKRKFGTKKDFSWFLEDDFDIGCHMEETSHLQKRRVLRIAQWVLLVLLVAALSCTLSITELKLQAAWDVPVWKWEVLLLVIICGQLLSGWGVQASVLLIESNFHLRMSVLYVMYGIRRSIQNVIWLSLVAIAWHVVVTEKILKDSENQVPRLLKKIMLCLLVGTSIWLLKTLIVKILASSFHLRSFFRRIRVSLYKQYVIKKLGGDLIEGKNRQETGHRETKNIHKLSRQESFKRLAKKRLVATRVKRLIEIVQAGDLPCLSTVPEDLPVRSDDDDEDESSLRTREQQVEDLARRVFRKVAQQSTCITHEDLKHHLGEDKLTKARELFTGAMCKVAITENGFTQWMVDAYRERRILALSLNDTKTAVDDLHHMMDVMVAIMIFIIWLIICGVPVTQFVIFMTTQLALAVYVFGNTGKTVIESIIFLFIMHPYDVGDRCEVDGTQMIVDEMTILTTVFLRYDSQKIIYPNSVLATKPIGNYSRSPAMSDEIEFSVHISTPWDKIELMKEKIRKYLDKKSDYWYSDAIIIVKNVEDMNRLKMAVWPKHAVNYHNMVQRWERRSALIEKMIRVFRKLDIEYRMLPVEMNVRNIGGVVYDRPPSNWNTCSGMSF